MDHRRHRGLEADADTALRLLHACVRAKTDCFDQIVHYLGANRPRTRRLLEDILRLEEEHAEELIGVLQIHRAAAEQEAARTT